LSDFSEFYLIRGCFCKPRNSSSSLFFVLILRTRSIDLVLPDFFRACTLDGDMFSLYFQFNRESGRHSKGRNTPSELGGRIPLINCQFLEDCFFCNFLRWSDATESVTQHAMIWAIIGLVHHCCFFWALGLWECYEIFLETYVQQLSGVLPKAGVSLLPPAFFRAAEKSTAVLVVIAVVAAALPFPIVA
ncbi:hypothetical protein Taro_030707, partial [Colocasia esculenta]|nr:hypothetical protein [Colocasia esculenta]